jgi:hypothetical protein
MQTLSGTKDSNTSIYINGYEVVSLTNDRTWSYSYALDEGNNYLIITSRDVNNLESISVEINIFLDTSPPTTSSVTDDGIYTTSTEQLHASWISEDPETGIVEYQYAIGTAVGGTDVVDWTSSGTLTEITHTGLSLIQSQTYYISVKARNGAGAWSPTGCSDGIKVNQHIPEILEIQPPDGSNGYAGDNIDFTVTARDEDSDVLLYQFSLYDTQLEEWQVIQPWQNSPNFTWSATAANFGIHTIKIEVNDGNGGLTSQQIRLYLLRRPPEVP